MNSEKDPPIRDMISLGAVPVLVEYLADDSQPNLQVSLFYALLFIFVFCFFL